MRENQKIRFEKPETAAWIEKIRKSVKDPAELEKLIWQHPSGFLVNSFYREENLAELAAVGLNPLKSGNDWEIRQPVYTHKIQAANQWALQALENGAHSLEFRGTGIQGENDFSVLFKGLHLDWFPAHFDFGDSNTALLYLLLDYFQQASYDTHTLHGSIQLDPLRDALRQGNLELPEKETWRLLQAVLETGRLELPNYKTLAVHGVFYANAGATAVQELAFSLAQAVAYFNGLGEAGVAPEHVYQSLHFHFGTGSSYFTEMAKFRAWKLLFPLIAEEFQLSPELPYTNAVTLQRNKTLYDSHSNLLRATTEAMSAAIGGVHAITVEPYDVLMKEPDTASYRWARNIQVMLQEESRLNWVGDAAAGSYYIEVLTNKIAEQAWDLFREVEREGGWLAAAKNKMLQRHIESSAKKENELFREQKKILVGANKYVNTEEHIAQRFNRPVESLYFRDVLEIVPVKEERIAGSLEMLRMKNETQQA